MVRKQLIAVLFSAIAAFPALAEDGLLYLTSRNGQDRLIAAELNQDYFSLATYLESEQILTFCGPATVAAVANSLNIERPSPARLYPWRLFTQDTVFNSPNQQLKPYAQVEHEGLTLDELAAFIENLGLVAKHRFADEVSADTLRQSIIDTLSDPSARFIVNYSRRALPQDGDGHISPVGAYDKATDSILVLDVAKYKYPPVWISIEKLHEAMLMIDQGSKRSRGFVQVSVP